MRIFSGGPFEFFWDDTDIMTSKLHKHLKKLREQLNNPPSPPPKKKYVPKTDIPDTESGLPSDILNSQRKLKMKQLTMEAQQRRVEEEQECSFRPTTFSKPYVPRERPPKSYWDSQGRLLESDNARDTAQNSRSLNAHLWRKFASESVLDRRPNQGPGELRRVRTLKYLEVQDLMMFEKQAPGSERKPKRK